MDTIPQDTPQGKYYTYTLAYPESMGGRVFYVGKGSGRRIYHHEHRINSKGRGKNPYKEAVIRKILNAGEQVTKTIVARFDTEEEAFIHEIALIFFMDGLTNLTNGGEGSSGWKATPELRKWMSKTRRGMKRSPESCKRIADSNRIPCSEEKKISIGKANTGKKRTPAQLQRLADAHQGIKKSQEDVLKTAHENNGMSKLTIKEVHIIRQKRSEGMLIRELADMFHVSIGTIGKVVTNQLWKNV